MDILDALAQQKIDCYAHSDRIICNDGLLSVSDSVFEVTMRRLGFDKEDINEWMQEDVTLRHKFIEQWDGE